MPTPEEILQKYGGTIALSPAPTAPAETPGATASPDAILQKYGGTVQTPPTPASPQASGWRSAMRLPVLAVQGIGKGVLDALGTPADLLNLYLKGAHALATKAGIPLAEPAEVPLGSQTLHTAYTETLPDTLGIARPITAETPGERILERTARTASSAVATAPFFPGQASIGREAALGTASGAVGGATEEATGSPMLGTAAQIATALSPLALQGAKAVVQRTGPGKLFARNQAVAQLDETDAAAQAELKALRLRSTEEQRALHLHQDALARTKDRELALAREQALATRQGAATTARQWAKKMPVPTDDEVKALYADVDQYQFLLPTDLLDDARAQLGTRVQTVKKFFPKASLGEMERLSTTPQAPASATPSGPALPELQKFIRDNQGIATAGEELTGELTALTSPKQTGTTGLLNNKTGLSLQQMAEKANEAGYLQSADKTELLEALDRSMSGSPVYSLHDSGLMDDIAGFFDRAGGLAPTMPAEMTFQEARSLLKWLGQEIGSLEGAKTPGAGTQLGATKLLYSKIQETIDRAITQGDLPDAARQALERANSAYKVQATTESLADAIERYITDGKFNAAGLLDHLRKSKDGGFLRQRLYETGALEDVERTLHQLDSDIKTAAKAIPDTRERLTGAQRANRRALREQAEALADQEAAIRAPVEAQRAALPPPVTPPRIEALAATTGLAGGITSAMTGDITQGLHVGLMAAAPLILSRALMTGWSQRQLVRRLLASQSNTLNPAILRILGTTVARHSATTPEE